MVERLTVIGDADRAALVALLIDAVADGASVGFLAPLAEATAEAYWHGVVAELGGPARVLLVTRAGGRIVGAVQLALASQPNASHRAEVQKLLVHTSCRRQGLGAALMAAAEQAATAAARSLLVLDTRTGDAASRLYERLGYQLAGTIPRYARNSSGTLEGTSFYYRHLDPTPATLGG